MTELTLVIGNKNYSSWSLRPWLFLRLNNIAFREIRIPLYEAESKALILQHSPSGKVPLLHDGEFQVWDSLAICLHVIERFAPAHGWPADAVRRAEARSLVAEMHSGFTALRSQLSMNCRRVPKAAPFDAAAGQDIARIDAIWSRCRERFAGDGPGLFGDWSIADAFFAPVVLRFDRYCLPCSATSRQYMDNVLALPAMQAWVAAAREEAEKLQAFEVQD